MAVEPYTLLEFPASLVCNRWWYCTGLYYGELLTEPAATQLDIALEQAAPEQKVDILLAARVLYALLQPSKYVPGLCTRLCAFRQAIRDQDVFLNSGLHLSWNQSECEKQPVHVHSLRITVLQYNEVSSGPTN